MSTRRQFLTAMTTASLSAGLAQISSRSEEKVVERWGIFELTVKGPSTGNPFLEVRFGAEFRYQHRRIQVDGFYDGDGLYKVRFMPDVEGRWSYTTTSNVTELNGISGEFECIQPSTNNHGPVRVRNLTHFAYEDGTPYFPVGTTCYAWIHQTEELQQQTLRTLAQSPFNKLRMCVFPKDYIYNKNEPPYYPFPRSASGENDYSRFNPAFFRHLERRVADLLELGIEADIILFHPYDRWGYENMPPEVDDRYLRYVVARLSAFRNVWWSLANEFDFMRHKTMDDWDRFFRIVQESDPYQHLRSIHNGYILYDHLKPWVTHVSLQSSDLHRAREFVEQYRKPVIFDECRYEGNIPRRWGNISAQEMVRRFWLATVGGAYCSHGETYLDPNDILWWSKGGTLRGQSPPRIAFLRKILEEGPPQGLQGFNSYYPCAGVRGQYYLWYLDLHQPAEYTFEVEGNGPFAIDLIDPWEMTIQTMGIHQGPKIPLKLPGRPHLAIRMRRLG